MKKVQWRSSMNKFMSQLSFRDWLESDPDPEDNCHFYDALDTTLKKLSKGEQKLVSLIFEDGKSHQEIAQELRISSDDLVVQRDALLYKIRRFFIKELVKTGLTIGTL